MPDGKPSFVVVAIVVYDTGNGAKTMIWPAGGSNPFWGEKDIPWEEAIHRPGTLNPGSIIDEICIHEGRMAPLSAAAQLSVRAQ